MEAEDLMKPRYKVVADYPNSKYPVNSILNFQSQTDAQGEYWFCLKPYWILLDVVEKYPNIFKPLQWWEERTDEELPKYVKLRNGTVVAPVIWNQKQGIVYFKPKKYSPIPYNDFHVLQGSIPATQQQYIDSTTLTPESFNN